MEHLPGMATSRRYFAHFYDGMQGNLSGNSNEILTEKRTSPEGNGKKCRAVLSILPVHG